MWRNFHTGARLPTQTKPKSSTLRIEVLGTVAWMLGYETAPRARESFGSTPRAYGRRCAPTPAARGGRAPRPGRPRLASRVPPLTTAFSLTIVALRLASSSYTPRVLRSFISDRGVQVVLGAFVATFLYSLLVLRIIREAQAEAPRQLPRTSSFTDHPGGTSSKGSRIFTQQVDV